MMLIASLYLLGVSAILIPCFGAIASPDIYEYGPWTVQCGNVLGSSVAASPGPTELNPFVLYSYNPTDSLLASPVIDTEGNLYFTSCYEVISITSKGLKRWTAKISVSSCNSVSPTIGHNNTLIINQGTSLLALSSVDGSKIWEVANSNFYYYPVVDALGNIYISYSYGLLALNSTGAKLWTQSIGAEGVVIANSGSVNQLIISTRNGYLTAWNSSGAVVWQANILSQLPTPSGYSQSYRVSNPSIGPDETVYVTISVIFIYTNPINYALTYKPQLNTLLAFNQNGNYLWQAQLGTSLCNQTNTPVAASQVSISSYGTLYVTSASAMNKTNNYLKCTYQVQLFTIDPINRTVTPSSPLYDVNNPPQFSNPTVGSKGTVYFAVGSTAYALNSAGILLWTYLFPEYPGQLVMGANSTLYAVTAYFSYSIDGYIGNVFSLNACNSSFVLTDNETTCSACSNGEYKSASYNNYCQKPCATGYFQENPQWNPSCDQCPYPYTNVASGQRSCHMFCLCVNTPIAAVVFTTICVLYAVCILASKQRLTIFLVLFFPTLDVFTDLAYLLTTTFYTSTVFSFGVLFFSYSGVVFTYKLFASGKIGRCPYVQWRNPPFAMMLTEEGTESRLGLFREHPELHYWIAEIVAFIIATPLVIAYILLRAGLWLILKLLLLLPVILGLPFVCLWISIGSFLHMTKTLCIGNVWNVWHQVFLLSHDMDTDINVDTAELNEGLFYEFVFESFPQFLLQVSNNTLMGQWTPLGILSTAVSFYMACNGFYKFWYFQRVKQVSMEDIPVYVPFFASMSIVPNSKHDNLRLLSTPNNNL